MITDDIEQDEEVVAVIAAFIRDAESLAERTAALIEQSELSPGPGSSTWPVSFLLDAGAIARIRDWEDAGLKDAIDVELPCSVEAWTALTQELHTTNSRNRRTSPLLKRVVTLWWRRCAHPIQPSVDTDFAIDPVSKEKLLPLVAQLLWNFRNLQSSPDSATGA